MYTCCGVTRSYPLGDPVPPLDNSLWVFKLAEVWKMGQGSWFCIGHSTHPPSISQTLKSHFRICFLGSFLISVVLGWVLWETDTAMEIYLQKVYRGVLSGITTYERIRKVWANVELWFNYNQIQPRPQGVLKLGWRFRNILNWGKRIWLWYLSLTRHWIQAYLGHIIM